MFKIVMFIYFKHVRTRPLDQQNIHVLTENPDLSRLTDSRYSLQKSHEVEIVLCKYYPFICLIASYGLYINFEYNF